MARTVVGVLAFAGVLAGVSASALGQVTLKGTATADNLFSASVSTSPVVAGTTWLSGDNWQAPFSGSTVIDSPGTYYLHVRAQDLGRPEMFIGIFELVGADATFANGTQNLVTNATDWTVSTSGFGLAEADPVVIGPNGTGPWGNKSEMGGASYVWAPVYADGVAYFTSKFTVVPGPSALAMGLIGLVTFRRRR